MGLSNHLKDVSSDSIPILLVVAAAGWVSYLRSLLLCALNSVGLLRQLHGDAADVGAGLTGILALADHINANPPFSYESDSQPLANCVVCLCGLGEEGMRIRRLPCCHVFHADCLDGWLDQMNLSCPLCRFPLAGAGEADRRIGAELVAWLCPY